MFISIFKSILAVVVGLVLISLIVEPIEFAVVTILNGSVTTDPLVYFQIRNQIPVLLLKMIYNTLGAMVGGFVTAFIAGKWQVWHGIALAIVQTVALIGGMLTPPYGELTPMPVWLALIAFTFPAIVFGAWLRQSRMSVKRV
jgi:hypothetical protein